tara:strand:+ start:255 stop:923 length:669 start_codon:yes stop_codon:yes gene_type:complete
MVFDSFHYRGFHGLDIFGSIMALWCSIRTFSKHAAELGNQQPSEPVFFVKPSNCIQTTGSIKVSSHPGSVHHEVECVLRLDENLELDSIAVGLDLTDRDKQSELREEQLPWSKAKCFKGSAIIGNFSKWQGRISDLSNESSKLVLRLKVNEEIRQEAKLSSMTIKPEIQMESLLKWAPVQSGDYIFTGTPSGVEQLFVGDRVYASLETVDGKVISSIDTVCE